MLKEIITKWLGEPREIDGEFWANKINREGMTRDAGYNLLHQDLKSRIPELEEMILGGLTEPLADAFYECNLDPEEADARAISIINTLKGVK